MSAETPMGKDAHFEMGDHVISYNDGNDNIFPLFAFEDGPDIWICEEKHQQHLLWLIKSAAAFHKVPVHYHQAWKR